MTEKKILDLPEAVRLVLEVIEEKGGDFVHQDDPIRMLVDNGLSGGRCVNIFAKWSDKVGNDVPVAPGCLVGSAIHKAGWPLQKFIDYDAIRSSSTELLKRVVKDGLYDGFTDLAHQYLSSVQSSQDCGNNWAWAHQSGMLSTLEYFGSTHYRPHGVTTLREVEFIDPRDKEKLLEQFDSYS